MRENDNERDERLGTGEKETREEKKDERIEMREKKVRE